MRDKQAIRERYLRDALPIRLGGLAANLARVESFSDHLDHREAVNDMLDESKFFIEWTASDAELVELQRQIAQWQYCWIDIWNDPERRSSVAVQAGEWSNRILKLSGLL